MSAATWHYDYSKRMSYKHASTCHGAELEQKMLFNGKVVTDPKFQIVTTGENLVKRTERVRRKWWQFWKPKFTDVTTEKLVKGQNVKNVHYRYYCTECGKQDDGEWEFKND